jgi:uncharacterized OB-fold protein
MEDDQAADSGPKAATPYLKFAESDRPYLEGSRCGNCGQVLLGARENCPRCAGRGTMVAVELSTRGKLYNYTIVYRSYPGIVVPFISAIIDLDGGGTVKGNLLDVEADPEKLPFDMPVEMVFRGAEIANPAGAGFISHFFIPATAKGAV